MMQFKKDPFDARLCTDSTMKRLKFETMSGSLDLNRIFDFQGFWLITCTSINHKNVSCKILYISMQISKAQHQNLIRFCQYTLFYSIFDFAKASLDLHEKYIKLHEKQVLISRE